ncbi:restriction endonuclease subunit S, partial [Thiolapillus sp.]|uniref:restriction endonuclease subunit S n=5 Tax=Thiolapillus sp. TaxID=2017437 RepID=UPI003AF7FDD8
KSDKKKPLVPRLRFPEFREAGAWEVKRLGEVCEINPSTGDLPDNFIYIDLESVVAGQLVKKQKISKEGAPSRAQRVLESGDVIYQTVRPYQKNNYLFDLSDGNRYVASTGYAQFRAHDSENFLFQLIHTDSLINKVLSRCTGSNYPAINSSDLSKIQVVVPRTDEQQKIAHCLSSLDEVIGLQAKKVQALKQHKKGLMQQLFPAEGETTPRLRFPEFREAGAWEVRRLGEIGKISKGKGISKSDIKPNGALPCIRYGELYTHYGEVIRDVVSFTDANPGNLVLSEENDVIIPASGETKEDIATASCVSVKGVALGGDLNIFYSPMNGMFLAYYIRGNLKFEISKVAQGNSVVHLYTTQLEKLKLAVPPYPKEQQKIAHCLSSLDEVIGLESDKLDALKNLKKGLMQQLFPQEVA